MPTEMKFTCGYIVLELAKDEYGMYHLYRYNKESKREPGHEIGTALSKRSALAILKVEMDDTLKIWERNI